MLMERDLSKTAVEILLLDRLKTAWYICMDLKATL
jgi:hypothetical protein